MLAITAVGLAFAPAASAYLRDFQASFFDSPFTSESPRFVTSSCPRAFSEPQVLLGRGGFVTSRSTLGLTKLEGGVGLRHLVGGAEVRPDSAKWHLNGQLLCATRTAEPPAGSPAGGTYLKGVYIRRSESARNSSSPKEHRVSCLGRDVAIGAGFHIVRPPSGKEPRAIARGVQVFQSGGVSGARAVAHESERTDLSWSLAAHAICANVTDALPTATYVDVPGSSYLAPPRTSSRVKDLAPRCRPGEVVVGGGAAAFGDGAGAPPRGVMLTASHPFGNGWSARAVEVNSTDRPWGLETRALCAALKGPTLTP